MPLADDKQPVGINTYRETSLHRSLKLWAAGQDGQLEVNIDGHVIDVIRGDRLIEVQTRSLGALKRKLGRLLPSYPVEIVYPIAERRWLVTLERDGRQRTRRRSPKRGHLTHVFNELVYIQHLLPEPNLCITVVLTEEEEIRVDDGKGSWRRHGLSIQDRRLLSIHASHRFASPQDWLTLLPVHGPEPFTTRDIATKLGQPLRTAQKMAYCLRALGLIAVVGKQSRSTLYQRNE